MLGSSSSHVFEPLVWHGLECDHYAVTLCRSSLNCCVLIPALKDAYDLENSMVLCLF